MERGLFGIARHGCRAGWGSSGGEGDLCREFLVVPPHEAGEHLSQLLRVDDALACLKGADRVQHGKVLPITVLRQLGDQERLYADLQNLRQGILLAELQAT